MINHIDLFSGIGGFAFAVDTVWGKENVNHIFCDNNKFCQQVIKKHWPNSYIYDDIRAITNTESGQSGKSSEQKGWQDFGGSGCDILTGGFPCQPFSQAGRRKGTADDRFLWPEMFRVIQLTKPQWVIAENVRGIINIQDGVVFQQVCLDLESEGYEVQPFIIPAVAVNAPHRRDRVWFVANRKDEYEKWGERDRSAIGEPQTQIGNGNINDTNTPSVRCNNGSYNGQARQVLYDQGLAEENKQERQGRECGIGTDDNVENPISERRGGWMESEGQILECESTEIENARPSWERNWIEVATEFCSVDDGLPVELGEFKLSKAGHRVEQLKAYGNAIVPQVAIEIMKIIKS